MKIAFVLDRLAALNPAVDATVALMRAAQAHGHTVYSVEVASLCWLRAEAGHPGVFAEVAQLQLPDEEEIASGAYWYRECSRGVSALRIFDRVLLRCNSSADGDMQATTWLLARAEAEGVRVFNRPAALRDLGDKLGLAELAEFTDFTPPMLVSRQLEQLQGFIEDQRDVILKPVQGCGGRDVFRVHRHDSNRNAILDLLTQQGRRTIIAQRYLPEIKQGDRRIFIAGDQVLPYCLVRIPRTGETRASLETGCHASARELTRHERQMAESLVPLLYQRGIIFAALDMIGDYLCEINITNPGGLVELQRLSGFDAATACMQVLERRGLP
jgi:glutathione synthase